MAIQFNCPYCTVTIQVPDHAAGKKGTCPQCGTKLVVPIPKSIPRETVPAPPPFSSPPAAPNFAPYFAPQTAPNFVPQPMPGYSPAPGMPMGFDPTQPLAAPPGYGAPPGFVASPAFVPASATAIPSEPPSLATKSRKKRKTGGGAILWGLAVVVIVVGAVLAFVFLKPGAKPDPLSGKLTATRLANGKLQPALVHRDWIEGIDEETVSTVLKQMEKRTVTLRSDMVILKFQGAAEGIKITAAPGLHGELVAVDIASHKALSNWSQKHAGKLSDQHQKEVIRAAKTFIQEWAKAEASGDKKLDFSRYHDDLGIAALTSGLGAEAIAIIGQTVYGCVAEQQGLLYFLLPVGTERFELEGREHGKDNVVFPGHFVVDVEAETAPKKTDKAKKTDEETEMPDDDGEMKTKSFGKPALNDPSAIDETMPEKPMPEKPKSKKKKTKNDN